MFEIFKRNVGNNGTGESGGLILDVRSFKAPNVNYSRFGRQQSDPPQVLSLMVFIGHADSIALDPNDRVWYIIRTRYEGRFISVRKIFNSGIKHSFSPLAVES